MTSDPLHDNDPCNGIALAPSFHWALDKNILSPGPDLKWHVSKLLDKRNRDYHCALRALVSDLRSRTSDLCLNPRMDGLEWRINRLTT